MNWKNLSELIGIGERIQDKREERGITQRELADLTKIGLRTIQKYENNEVNPKVETLQKIADVLDADLEEFILGQTKESFEDLSVYYFLLGIKHPKTFIEDVCNGLIENNGLYYEIEEAKKFIDGIKNDSLRDSITYFLIGSLRDWIEESEEYISMQASQFETDQLEEFIKDTNNLVALNKKLNQLENDKNHIEELIEEIREKIFSILEKRYFSENHLSQEEE